MAGRSPVRFLAPIALVAFAFGLYTVVQNARESVGSDPAAEQTATPSPKSGKDSGKKSTKRKRKTYTVRTGDTPSGIAEENGISLDTLMELNPDLDAQTLTPGQRVKLSE
jgi:LysM repeat protein